MPFHIVLHQPEIPQNTGSIGRLCVSTDSRLHLIHPLGFSTDDYYLRRAGLDYWEHLAPEQHRSWEAFRQAHPGLRLWLFTTRGGCQHTEARFDENDALVFGCETAGLPLAILDAHPDRRVRIPMPGTFHRSLNLAQAAAIGLYEALRQTKGW